MIVGPKTKVPAHIRALVGMVACHAAGTDGVAFQLDGTRYRAKIRNRDGSTSAWNGDLTAKDAVMSLELLDQSINSKARENMRGARGE